MDNKLQDVLKKLGFREVNEQNEYDRTALFYAQTAEQTKTLIEAGADVNIQDEDGCTAIVFAKNEEQKKLLLNAGAEMPEDIPLLGAKSFGNDNDDYVIDSLLLRDKIELRKNNILKSRQLRKTIEAREGKVSGAVIAEDVISGKEKRTITPGIGAEIKRRKMAEK